MCDIQYLRGTVFLTRSRPCFARDYLLITFFGGGTCVFRLFRPRLLISSMLEHNVYHARGPLIFFALTTRTILTSARRTVMINYIYIIYYIYYIIRAKRVSNCYIPPKKSARVRVCSTNLGFSVEKIVLVLVWDTYYVPRTYVPGTSERFVANCGVGPSTRGQGDSASLVKPTQDQRR